MASQKKQLQVEDISNIIEKSDNFALVKFEGTPHLALEKLRSDLRKTNSKLRVIKNSLFEKAVNKLASKNKDLKDFASNAFPLKDTSALLTFEKDYMSGLSAFHKYADKETTLTFKFGFIDNKLLAQEQLVTLAKLPSREELLARLIGSLKAPQSRVVIALKFNISKLVYVLKAKGGVVN